MNTPMIYQGYPDYYNASSLERNSDSEMRLSMASAINALMGGRDYSNGAIGWQGEDIKYPLQNGSYTRPYDDYKAGKYSWKPNAVIYSGAKFNRQTLSTPQNGRNVYEITDSAGGTIFWKPKR